MIDPNEQLTPHFKLGEFTCHCCHDVIRDKALELASRLEPVREDVGPIVILSGFRCFHQNILVHGKTFSRHLTGEAADIACQDDATRFLLVTSLLTHGFVRIGIGRDFIHADISTITGPVIWTYY